MLFQGNATMCMVRISCVVHCYLTGSLGMRHISLKKMGHRARPE